MKVAVYNCTSSEEVNNVQVGLLTELVESVPEWEFSVNKDVFSDVGASKLEIKGRPALEELISRAKSGEYELIVVKAFTSLLRNATRLLELIDELSKCGVGICFLDNQVSTLQESDYYTLMFMAQAEEKVRTKAGGNESRILGYDKVFTKSGVKYEINMEEVFFVVQIYGSVLRGSSLEEIKFGLEFAGCLNAVGEEEWSIDMIRSILCNPIYKGETSIGIVASPIIDAEVWELVQKVIS